MLNNLSPDKSVIKKHLEFIIENCRSHDDGLLEISRLTGSNLFSFDDIDNAVECALSINHLKSTYLCGAFLNPESPPFGRSSDDDFYTTSVIWADIDDPHDSEALKKLYKHMPPSRGVITARKPHRRIQLWWKLTEPLDCADTFREALKGVQQNLGGDAKVTNITSLMRMPGTVNRPNDKKRSEGRIEEFVEYVIIPGGKPVDIDAFLLAYPVQDYTQITQIKENTPIQTSVSSGALNCEERIIDGRETYASEMIYASILNLTAKLGRWPDPQEVYDDVWPHYNRKVYVRGQSLDHDQRGSKMISQKIKSKLRLFINGGMSRYGHGTIESVIKAGKESIAFPSNTLVDAKDGEVVDTQTGGIKEYKNLPLLFASDITPVTETNDFVEDLLCRNQFSVIYGESNCGKTFFMLDLAMRVALGLRWRDKEVQQGGVIYAALEGGHGTKNRIAAFKKQHRIKQDIPLAIIPSSINFLDAEGDIQSLIHAINKAKERIDNVQLIVIDTLARAISGGDENSSSDMGQMIINADALRETTGAHISFIHHSGKDAVKGARGHSSLRAAVDTEIEISRTDDQSPSKGKVVKQREMEMIDEFWFSLEHVQLGENQRNKPVSSCVVVEALESKKSKPVKLNVLQQFILDCLDETIKENGRIIVPEKNMIQCTCVDYDQLRRTMEKRGFKEIMETENKTTSQQIKSATQTARLALKRHGKINFNSNYLWIIEDSK